MIKKLASTYLHFDKKNYPWKSSINYRLKPELYKVGKGEQGVLICEPYKSELLPYWKFKTPKMALKSSQDITNIFKNYLRHNDFVGADMARKFLQMGFTRSRRYANYKGGMKFDKSKNYMLMAKGTGDPKKTISAAIFYKAWQQAENVQKYKVLKEKWKQKYG